MTLEISAKSDHQEYPIDHLSVHNAVRVKKIYPRMLHQEIAYIYRFTDHGSQNSTDHVHLPDGSFDLMIHWGQSLKQRNDSDKLETLPGVRVAGGHKQAFHLHYPKHFTIYAVVFKPGYAASFMPALSDIAADKHVAAEEIFGPEINHLAEKVAQTHDAYQAAWMIESFLLKKRNKRPNYYTAHINRAAHLLQHHTHNLDGICREIGMSERNFRRVFRQLTGFSPQKLLQLKRVRLLSRLLNKQVNAEQAVEKLGYYDLSHLTNDFKAVAKQTPQQYVSSLNAIDSAFHLSHQG